MWLVFIFSLLSTVGILLLFLEKKYVVFDTYKRIFVWWLCKFKEEENKHHGTLYPISELNHYQYLKLHVGSSLVLTPTNLQRKILYSSLLLSSRPFLLLFVLPHIRHSVPEAKSIGVTLELLLVLPLTSNLSANPAGSAFKNISEFTTTATFYSKPPSLTCITNEAP